jgi:hypothetical protein
MHYIKTTILTQAVHLNQIFKKEGLWNNSTEINLCEKTKRKTRCRFRKYKILGARVILPMPTKAIQSREDDLTMPSKHVQGTWQNK